MAVINDADDLQRVARGFQASRILLTAYELGVFGALGDGRRTSAEVARALGTDARATDRLLNALVALGMAEKDEGRFANGPAAARYLVPGKPEYMSGLMHAVHLWETWGTLTGAVRAGTSVWGGEEEEREEGEVTKAFIAAMDYRASRVAAGVVALLDLAGVWRVLDVGGGSGAYAGAFVRAGVRATVFDLPDVIPLTRNYVAREGLGNEVDFVAGDYTNDDLGRGFDLVFLSQIIHANSFAANVALMTKAAAALAPGGRVVVQDFVVDEGRTGPPGAVVFALNMLVATEAGDTYTEGEIREMMARAGFADVKRVDTPFETTLMIGKKP